MLLSFYQVLGASTMWLAPFLLELSNEKDS
jgi:hypothetical protein